MKKYILLLIISIIAIPSVKATEIENKISSLNSEVNSLNTEVNNLNNIDDLYPVGSIYITTTSTNPGSTLGGTWAAYGTGRQLVGVGSNGTTNYSYNSTGGSSTKTLVEGNVPKHSHTLTPKGSISNTFTGTAATTSSSGGHSHTVSFGRASEEASGYGLWYNGWYAKRVIVTDSTITSSSAGNHSHTLTATGSVKSTFTGTAAYTNYQGSGTAFSIQNPYITVYMWKRTA